MLQVKVTPLRSLKHECLHDALARLFCDVLDSEEEPDSVFEEWAGVDDADHAGTSHSPDDINMVFHSLLLWINVFLNFFFLFRIAICLLLKSMKYVT